IQRKKYPSVRLEVLPKIVQEELPFRHAPGFFLYPVESGGERGDPIKFPAQVRRRFECLDFPGLARHAEQIQQIGEHRIPLEVESETAMTELLADVEKEPTAAAQIQDVLRRATL